MNVIEISNNFDFIPIPVFELEMDELLKELEYLANLII